MKRYLAESTLKKKYRETGLSKEAVKKLRYYLLACVNLYGTLTLDEVWRVVKTVERRQRKNGMSPELRRDLTEAVEEYIYSVNGSESCEEIMNVLAAPLEPELEREQFDAFMEVAAREQNMFVFNTEDQFYDDGKAEVTYVSDLKLLAGLGSIEELYDKIDAMESEDEEIPLKLDGFFAVNEARQGQTLIVPEDMLCYICQTYYHMTEESKDIWNFLSERFRSLTAVQASLLVFRFYSIIRNPLVSDADKVQEAVSCVEKYGRFRNPAEIQEFSGLLYDFASATRLMEYKGQSPQDIAAARAGAIQQKPAAAGGNLFFNELAMKAAQEALKPGETKVVNKGGTVIKGKKIGPNEPCPCGSGKKYKKCCGRVVNDD